MAPKQTPIGDAPTCVVLRSSDRDDVAHFLKVSAGKDGSRTCVAQNTSLSVLPESQGCLDNAAELKKELARLAMLPGHVAMLKSRKELPAYVHRAELLACIAANSVTIVRGATGCGKSTQLPQLILEEAAAHGQPCHILVAQPRRLATTALADRVAAELADDAGVGGLCGYRIRGESKTTSKTVLTFVTTGLLLRQLESDPMLSSLTHVVVDEVHERSVDVDLLLLGLRRILSCDLSKHPRIVLMSATVDASAFVEYFGCSGQVSIGVCDVPGRTFPVSELFLEDAIDACGYVCSASSLWARTKPLPDERSESDRTIAAAAAAAAEAAANSATNSTVATNLAARALKLSNAAAASHSIDEIGAVASDWLRKLGADGAKKLGSTENVGQTLRTMELSLVNEELVEMLVRRHHASTRSLSCDGAVLVFLPGVAEIESLRCRLQAGASRDLRVLPLHSKLSASEQRSAFLRPPSGVTKVILATDIAETSVTIPDVTLVIDGGLHRTVSCDQRTGVAHLHTVRVSLAAAKQRAGRAGRVQAGTCYHLYCKIEPDSGAMAAEPAAEILRVPLESLCLRVRALLPHDERPVAKVLAEALSSPPAMAVARAAAALVALGALHSDSEGLTPLGAQLASLPVDPKLGKALLCAASFGCLSPVAFIVACLSAPRGPFGGGAEAAVAKRSLDMTSDHMALVRAQAEWRRRGSSSCESLGISEVGMRDVERDALRLVKETTQLCGDRGSVDERATDMGLVKGCILMGLASHVMRVQLVDEREPRDKSRRRWQLKWHSAGIRNTGHVLKPHPGSLLADGRINGNAGDFCVCYGILRSARGVAALDFSLVSPLAVLLLAGDVGAHVVTSSDKQGFEDYGSDGVAPAILQVGGEMVSLSASDDMMLAELRCCIASAVGSTSATGSLAALLSALLKDMDAPWSGVPEGWVYEEDCIGKPLYKSIIDASTATRVKPTETAARVVARAQSLLASKAQRAAAAKLKQETKVAEPALNEAEQAASAASKAEAIELAAAKRAAAETTRKEFDAAEAAAVKEVTLGRLAAEEARAREKASVAGKSVRGGVAKLLVDLELQKYAMAFEEAGYDDSKLQEVAEIVDEDPKGDGPVAVDEMIEAVGLKGGAAVKLRRFLLEPSKNGPGGGGEGKGGAGGRGGGKAPRASGGTAGGSNGKTAGRGAASKR